MAARGAGIILIVPFCFLITIGARHASTGALIGWSLAGAGLLVAFGARRWRRGRPAGASGPDPHDVLAAVTLPASSVPVADLATEELCAAWRRSYFQLLLATDAAARRQVAQRRQEYLDEIDRRDRLGFLRWLGSGAEAGGDPGPYLTTGSKPS